MTDRIEREKHLAELEENLAYLAGLPGTSITPEWLAAFRDLRAESLARSPLLGHADDPQSIAAASPAMQPARLGQRGVDPVAWAASVGKSTEAAVKRLAS